LGEHSASGEVEQKVIAVGEKLKKCGGLWWSADRELYNKCGRGADRGHIICPHHLYCKTLRDLPKWTFQKNYL